MMFKMIVRSQLALMKTSNSQKPTVANELAAEQCGGIPAADGQQVYKRRTTANETTSKTRTAAASGTLVAIQG